ncbi:Leucine rich repeat variant [Streptomyces sp. TLI_105]|nr:Leucine rich repeat variant [Streptomyces sp. TLI_105]
MVFAVDTVLVAALGVPAARLTSRGRRTRTAALGATVFALSFAASAVLPRLVHGAGALVEQLAADPDPGVARRIAARPEATPENLAELVERHGPAVFSAAAHRPGCPAAPLHRMAAHPTTGRRVLRAVARHPAAPAEALPLCLAAEDPDVRRYAATHPTLPVPVLESLLHGPDESLAGAAAENPALPVTLMERLAAE